MSYVTIPLPAARPAPLAGAQKVPSPKLDLFIRRDFLSADECDALVAMIDADCRPSTITDDTAGDSGFRTSQTCDLPTRLPLVALIETRIAAFLGLDVALGEPMQGQRYLVGQEFKAHTDYFEPTGADYAAYCGRAGQRSWTAMVYLNRPAAGGATRFRHIDKIVPAETGKLLCWNNLLPDGRVNGMTLHQGMKVRAGAKYILTKWFRQRPWPG